MLWPLNLQGYFNTGVDLCAHLAASVTPAIPLHHCRVLLQLMVLRADALALMCSATGGIDIVPCEQASRTGGSSSKREAPKKSTSVPLHAAPLPHVCIICADVHESLDSLTTHMRNHDSYHAVRDAVQGHPTCSHCKARFREIWELQRHVTRRSCPVFDSTLQPAGMDPDLQAALRSGRIVETLQNPTSARRTTSLHFIVLHLWVGTQQSG